MKYSEKTSSCLVSFYKTDAIGEVIPKTTKEHEVQHKGAQRNVPRRTKDNTNGYKGIGSPSSAICVRIFNFPDN